MEQDIERSRSRIVVVVYRSCADTAERRSNQQWRGRRRFSLLIFPTLFLLTESNSDTNHMFSSCADTTVQNYDCFTFGIVFAARNDLHQPQQKQRCCLVVSLRPPPLPQQRSTRCLLT
nr:uncharacterized LOC102588286 precursor [Ipomoea batatas]